ncbi:MAG: DNA recombination protein RmuC [Pseudomonadota bacterium]
MARFWKPALMRSEVGVDEAMAQVTQQTVGTGQTMQNNEIALLLFVAGIILVVIALLAVLYGRRNRAEYAYAEDKDLFEDDDYQDQRDDRDFAPIDDFSSIRVTREDDHDELAQREPGPLTPGFVDGDHDDVDQDQNTQDFDEQRGENVVPLRAAEAPFEQRPAVNFVDEDDMRQEALGVASSMPESRSDYDFGGTQADQDFEPLTSPASDVWGQAEHREQPVITMGPSYHDDDAPYVAPFIREYIDTAERRQTGRIDEMRDELRRQMGLLKEEQSNRLDLVLSSIDRKFDGFQGAFGGGFDYEEGASTRRRIDGLHASIERITQSLERQGERLADLARSFDTRLSDMTPLRGDVRTLSDDVRSFKSDMESNTMAVSDLRDELGTLQENFTRLERNFLEGSQTDAANSMRLADVVRGTLEEGAYQIGTKLSNGHKAGCVIFLQGGRSKVAIDDRFPIDAFNQLPSRDAVRRNLPQAKTGEDEFRRMVLRAIFGCADSCIVAGETADSAILFMPSEAAYTVLHDRFPDLVRDSHRARVWLTSPSTLMGTLNLLHNVLPGSGDEETRQRDRDYDDRDDGPFYAGPEERRQQQERRGAIDEAELERRLRALREEAGAIAEELERGRQTSSRRYRDEPATRRSHKDDFEARLERFTFDLDGDTSFETSKGSRRSFRDDRDDDLR